MARVLVVGAGATGAYFGARLSQAGNDVAFLVRPRRREVLRERGLRIVSAERTEVLHPELLVAGELADPYDAILLSVKAEALPAAIEDLAPAVRPGVGIIPFLNGMAHLDVLNDRFGPGAVLGGVVKVVTFVDDDGDIRQLAPMADMVIGEQSGEETPRLSALARDFGSAGFPFATSDRIVTLMWHKWVFIASAGAITVLMRGTIGEIAGVPGGADFAAAVVAEAAAVSAAAGHPMTAAEFAATTAQLTASGSAFAPSFYRDLARGLPTEVEHVFADLVLRGDKLGIETPLLRLATVNLRVHQNRVSAS
ncbi:2-dehydropantoate 2-reductase [Amycolatopsis rhabdoformis]|uniref:2-dehydropantoate 2-reductase n=1 Tax=Amycolatopsis rhabdoformis TaxID=1448059 RepID=A0ABZ1IDK0_9PSEU|nr:2-dehydropantoate 2-reductase [Amycolatopsis rhabdoformis]WSE32525.1 2-dehydropantoate 2-reductase [Amycolatopsis rhabdoformis]